ncbi:HEAT SHOCK PROTEIN 26 [Salix viminalis]|uniref:HEAT SHOCK PROTEIN 26 n=1 Tax=Salix viminalis TaxID=40686 RepID=A0A9Q0UTM0_SALVM|nr:HEAT SHOCK PROTEIN 26 [Salix viminalis]
MEPEIRTNEETAQVKEQAIHQGQFEEVEEVADHRSRETANQVPNLAEETERKELPGLIEQGKKQEAPKARSEDEETLPEHPERNELLQAFKDQGTKQTETSDQSSSQANLEHDAEENHPVRAEITQESVKMETETHAQEPSIPGPDQEKKLADESRNDEAQEINEATAGDIVEELEMVEEQKQKDLVEGARKGKNSVSRGTKLFPPLVAGSAILVSIIVFVISWIRAKKR